MASNGDDSGVDWDAEVNHAELVKSIQSFTGALWEYYNSLCEVGFTRETAMVLARDWQTIYWSALLATIMRGQKSGDANV